MPSRIEVPIYNLNRFDQNAGRPRRVRETCEDLHGTGAIRLLLLGLGRLMFKLRSLVISGQTLQTVLGPSKPRDLRALHMRVQSLHMRVHERLGEFAVSRCQQFHVGVVFNPLGIQRSSPSPTLNGLGNQFLHSWHSVGVSCFHTGHTCI